LDISHVALAWGICYFKLLKDALFAPKICWFLTGDDVLNWLKTCLQMKMNGTAIKVTRTSLEMYGL